MVELQKHRKKILQKWQDKVLESYTVKPVMEITGYIDDSTSQIFDKLVEVYNGGDYEGVEEPLDDLMRFLAVDGKKTPGDSIQDLFYLKELLDKYYNPDKKEWLKLNEIIDNFGYIAFNKYSACREEIYNMKMREKNRDLEIARRIIEYSGKHIEKMESEESTEK
ncbi:MAG: RsbRD N-terminal domain-containing protein [Archaeoglobaceae archaeon]